MNYVSFVSVDRWTGAPVPVKLVAFCAEIPRRRGTDHWAPAMRLTLRNADRPVQRPCIHLKHKRIKQKNCEHQYHQC